ncbi:hypothetical protein ACFL4O_00815 [bacterium]
MLLCIVITSYVCAQSNKTSKLNLSSSEHRNVPPKSFLTTVFSITNTGAQTDTFDIKILSPNNWEILKLIKPAILAPGQKKNILFTISVPHNALTGTDYSGKITVTSRLNKTREQINFTVGILPKARLRIIPPKPRTNVIPGAKIFYIFNITNLGNGNDTLYIEPSSIHGEKVTASIKTFDIKIGESKQITITVNVPKDTSPGTKHGLIFKAYSMKLDKDYSKKTIIYTPIIKKEIIKETLYKTLPSSIRLELTRWNQEDKLNPFIHFNTKDRISEKYWFEFNSENYYPKPPIENYWGVSENKTHLTVGSNKGAITAGYANASLTTLTSKSIIGTGVKTNISIHDFNIHAFTLQRDIPAYEKKFWGSKIVKKIDSNSTIGSAFLVSKIDYEKSADKDEDIISIFSKHKFKDFYINTELASNTSIGKRKKAVLLHSRYKKNRLSFDCEYSHGGADFFGERNSRRIYDLNSSYKFDFPLKIWSYRYNSRNNPEYESNVTTFALDKKELGISMDLSSLPNFSLSYSLDTSKNEKDILYNDSKEKSVSFRTYKAIGRYSLSLNSRWGRLKERIEPSTHNTSEYRPGIYMNLPNGSIWFKYSLSLRNNVTINDKISTERKFVGLQYKLLNSINSTFNYIHEQEPDRHGNIVSIDMVYEPYDVKLAFEHKLNDIYDDIKTDVVFWVSYTKQFGIPLPWVKTKGRVSGIVFIDENSNGTFDNKDIIVPNVSLLLDVTRIKANKNGKYKFPPVPEGIYTLNVDRSSLPFDLSYSSSVPVNISVKKGKEIEYNVALIRVCKIEGIVFEDSNDNHIKDENEKGYALARIILLKNSIPFKEAFSDINGRYVFSHILPGKYEITLDKQWLTKRSVLTDTSSKTLQLKPGEKTKDANLGFFEKQKKIRKTFRRKKPQIIK